MIALQTYPEFQPNTEGVFWSLPAEIYHRAPGISQSALKNFEQSPAHYAWRKDHALEPTPAMRFGTLAHTAILEPHLLDSLVIAPDRPRPSKKQINAKKPAPETVELIDFWKRWDAENSGKIAVSEEDRVKLFGVRDAVMNHPIARKALDTDIRECSVFVKFNLGGSVLRKLRIDAVRGNALVDVKTIENALTFEAQAFDLRYYRQAAFYLDGWNDAHPNDKKDAFVFIAVEKEPPHGVIVYEIDAEALGRGREEYINLLVKFIECEATNTWPNYSPEIRKLSLPRWARPKTEAIRF